MTDIADRFTAVLDANVIAGVLPRDILLSLAGAGFYRPRWSALILDEFEAYYTKKFDDAPGAAYQRSRMEIAFPDALVSDFDALMDVAKLPDPDDHHVLAAAIQTKAAVIVTNNLTDFPADVLARFELEARSHDQFVADILDMGGPEAISALREMRERYRNPALNAEAITSNIEQLGLQETAALLYRYQEFL